MHASSASITYQQLRVFAAVAELRSFHRAASALLLTEPAVSNHVRHLEQVVGAQLIVRSRGRRSVELTGAGTMLLKTCGSLFTTLDSALVAIRERHGPNPSTIAIGTGPNFGSSSLPPLIDSFREDHPGVDFMIEVGASQHLVKLLERGQIHLAVVASPEARLSLACEPYFAYEVHLVGPAGHRLAQGGPHPLNELAQESYIEPDEPMARRFGIEEMAAAAGVRMHVVMSGGDVHVRVQAVANGLGITPVDLATAVPSGPLSEAMRSRIAVLKVEGFPLRLERWLYYRRGELPGVVAEFRDHLLRHRESLELALATVPQPAATA